MMSTERELIVWSVAWGEYSFMLQALVSSMRRNGFKGKIVTFCDRPIKDSDHRPIDNEIDLDRLQFWKFEYLCKHMAKEPGKDLVFIDSDHYVVRDVSDILPKLLGDSPWHSFLEGPINTSATRRGDWWGCQNADFIKICRDFGLQQNEIRNSNGGFWAVKSEFAETSRRVAREFHEFAKKRGHTFPEEVSIAVLSHMFSEDHTARFAEKWAHAWGSEWTGTLQDRIPDGTSWKLVNYMTGESTMINPAIVHAMRSKSALIAQGKSIAGEDVVLAQPQAVVTPSPSVAAAMNAPGAPKAGCGACARKRQQMLEAQAKAQLEEAAKKSPDEQMTSPLGGSTEVIEQPTGQVEAADGAKQPSLMEKLREMIKR